MLAWNKQGYYEATKLQYECKLPESTYNISAVQQPRESGRCGAAPQITLSLLRNGTPLLNKVIFGYDCFGGPTVQNVELSDGLHGWFTQQMTLCFAPNSDSPGFCELLSETYDPLSTAIPINQEWVSEYVKNYR
jgi:hypothetical protein